MNLSAIGKLLWFLGLSDIGHNLQEPLRLVKPLICQQERPKPVNYLGKERVAGHHLGLPDT